MTFLNDVEHAAAPNTVSQANCELIERELWFPTAATKVAGVATTIIGPPVAGAHLKDERWVDANGAEWICMAAGTPGTWKQRQAALMAADPVAGAYPAGYQVKRTDARGMIRVCSVGGTPGTWVWQGVELAAIADAAGGATVDTEARAALNAVLAHLRTSRLILP